MKWVILIDDGPSDQARGDLADRGHHRDVGARGRPHRLPQPRLQRQRPQRLLPRRIHRLVRPSVGRRRHLRRPLRRLPHALPGRLCVPGHRLQPSPRREHPPHAPGPGSRRELDRVPRRDHLHQPPGPPDPRRPHNAEGPMRHRRGLTLIEVAITVAISTVIFSAIYTVLNSAVSGDRALRVRVDLQLDAVRTLREVTEVLKNSGPIDLNSNGTFDAGDYPYIWTDGVSNMSPYGGFYGYLDGTNPGIVQQATSANEGLGASQEIAFRQPKDVDGDGRPTRVADGAIEWGTDTFAIVLVPGPMGNELQFRRYNASNAVVFTRLL